jgi:hypothetical protein
MGELRAANRHEVARARDMRNIAFSYPPMLHCSIVLPHRAFRGPPGTAGTPHGCALAAPRRGGHLPGHPERPGRRRTCVSAL